MKNVIFSILLLCSSSSLFAQVRDSMGMPSLGTKVGIQEVVKLDSVSKKELYVRSKAFIINHFQSAKAVIQSDDAEIGILVGNGISDIMVKNSFGTTAMSMSYQMRFEVKEGKVRYTITDVRITSGAGVYVNAEYYWSHPKMTKPIVREIDAELRRLSKLIEHDLGNAAVSDF